MNIARQDLPKRLHKEYDGIVNYIKYFIDARNEKPESVTILKKIYNYIKTYYPESSRLELGGIPIKSS